TAWPVLAQATGQSERPTPKLPIAPSFLAKDEIFMSCSTASPRGSFLGPDAPCGERTPALTDQLFEVVRDLVQRHRAAHDARTHGRSRHPVDHGGLLALRDDDAARFEDRARAVRTVVPHAGHDDADRARAECARRAREQPIAVRR